jgi:UDP-N-acetylmuramate-alanine ligase
MHIHILGICGTFMGSLAVLAKQAGHHVTGCDHNVYPPMSTQLETQGIQLISGFDASQIQLKPDLFIIGNVVSRGNALMEEILNPIFQDHNGWAKIFCIKNGYWRLQERTAKQLQQLYWLGF